MMRIKTFGSRSVARSFAKILRLAGAYSTAVYPWGCDWRVQWVD